jgi:hypothetical protein
MRCPRRPRRGTTPSECFCHCRGWIGNSVGIGTLLTSTMTDGDQLLHAWPAARAEPDDPQRQRGYCFESRKGRRFACGDAIESRRNTGGSRSWSGMSHERVPGSVHPDTLHRAGQRRTMLLVAPGARPPSEMSAPSYASFMIHDYVTRTIYSEVSPADTDQESTVSSICHSVSPRPADVDAFAPRLHCRAVEFNGSPPWVGLPALSRQDAWPTRGADAGVVNSRPRHRRGRAHACRSAVLQEFLLAPLAISAYEKSERTAWHGPRAAPSVR